MPHRRGKGYPFETGLRVPMIVWVPRKWQQRCGLPMGQPSDRLVGFEDLMPTVLKLCGVDVPEHCEGRDFLGPDATGKPWQFCFRTNHGKHYGPVRTVTDGRYVYLRAFVPHQPFGLWQHYQWATPSHRIWHQMFHEDRLEPPQLRHMLPHRSEMLFDLQQDPWQLVDLSTDGAHAQRLETMRKAVAEHMRASRDLGLFPHSTRRTPDGTPLVDHVASTGFPLEDLIAAAERASLGDPAQRDALRDLLTHELPQFRFWGASGLALLAQRGHLPDVPAALHKAVDDDNVDVAAQAATAVLLAAPDEDALTRLADLMDAGHETASSALELLGDRVLPIRSRIEQCPHEDLKRPLLCALGLRAYETAYGPRAKKQGLKINTRRRSWRKPAPR